MKLAQQEKNTLGTPETRAARVTRRFIGVFAQNNSRSKAQKPLLREFRNAGYTLESKSMFTGMRHRY